MDINNLMDNVRDFFTEQYKGVENSNSFLSFEALGSMVDPDDFKAESEEISEIKAREQLSILGDRLPQIDDVFLTNSSRLSSLYEVLIESASFSGEKITAEDKSDYIAQFSEARDDCAFDYNEGIKASISMPEGDYLPVYGSPKKWYDPNGSFWVTKNFSVKEQKDSSPPKTSSGLKKTIPLVWKTKFTANPQLLKMVEAPVVKLKPIKVQNLKIQTVEHAKPAMMAAVSTPKLRQPITAANPRMMARPIAVATGTSTSAPPKPKPVLIKSQALSQWKNLNVLKHLSLAERTKFTSHIAQTSTEPAEPVRSNEFSMSFDYCIVNLERPWFNTSMFHYSNMWYCRTLKEDYFSTGTKDEHNSGVFKCIPTAMILIKDLKIKAAWTDDDKRNAENSVGLGIFNLGDSTFKENELVNPGIQIIGWMCEVMPRLPLRGDPNIIA